MTRSPKLSTLLSLLLHAGVVAIMVLATGVRDRPLPAARVTTLVDRDIGRYVALVSPREHGGGGGGAGQTLPASRGRLPKFELRPFTPPAAVVQNQHPLLSMEPALAGNPRIVVPDLNLPNYGDPMALPGPPSGGPGSGGGIGNGHDGGVGNRRGPGYGDHDGGGLDGNSAILAGLIQPVVLWKIEPEYTEEARKARIQGTVILRIEVDENGRARNISVRQSLGLGLDERAIEAVRQWKFRPGSVNGKPVVTSAIVHVTFRLL